MYAVVGCGDCRALWVVEPGADTSQCPRCGRTRPTDRRRQFVRTEDPDHARDVRARLLAARQDREDSASDAVSFTAAEGADSALADDELLEAAGLDTASLAPGDDADSPTDRTGIVRQAIRTLDAPTEDAILEFAADRAVPDEQAATVLSKLVRSGAVTVDGDTYRLVDR